MKMNVDEFVEMINKGYNFYEKVFIISQATVISSNVRIGIVDDVDFKELSIVNNNNDIRIMFNKIADIFATTLYVTIVTR